MTSPAISPQWLSTQFPDLADLAPLGGGGQKLVFSARHPQDNHVVLKLIRPPVDTDGFAREILAVEQVNSPRVPRILAYGSLSTPLGDCFWLREERIMGSTVRQLLATGPLPPRSLLRLGLHTLEALAAAEQVHIVHRDVKPENIMCADGDEFSLLDFGIARHLQLSSQTPTVAHFGKFTPGYGPPEQFRNIKRDIDARSDLFALGVTLYECATGRNPFRHEATNDIEILRRVETHPLVPLRPAFPSAGEFSDLVAALTQKRRDHRPPTALVAFNWMRLICEANGAC